MRLALLTLIVALGAEARTPPKSPPRDPRIVGLGHTCRKASDCRNNAQHCLWMADANGKPKDRGFCVLPCAKIDAGSTKVRPGQDLDAREAKKLHKKQPPRRCPPKFQCHGADRSTPIDICVKE